MSARSTTSTSGNGRTTSPRPRHDPLPSGVKETSGGTFDPDAGFTFFVASNPAAIGRVDIKPVLVAVNEVQTAAARDSLDRLLDSGRRVLIDSGIFNLAMEHVRAHGTSHDEALRLPPEEIDGFDRLWDSYAEIATTYADRVWGVIELDQGGAQNKPRTRERIETELGITPIPVYHPLLDGWDYYDTIASSYDRMCFGNLVQAPPGVRLRLIHTAYERARAYPYLWTHLLGVYPNQNILSLRLRGSSDASAWLTPVRWYPSWRGWSLLHMVTHYPTTMWPAFKEIDARSGFVDAEGNVQDAPRQRLGETLCGLTAIAAQHVLDDSRTDTHPDLGLAAPAPIAYPAHAHADATTIGAHR